MTLPKEKKDPNFHHFMEQYGISGKQEMTKFLTGFRPSLQKRWNTLFRMFSVGIDTWVVIKFVIGHVGIFVLLMWCIFLFFFPLSCILLTQNF